MRIVGAALLAALALVAAGCGGSNESASEDTTTIETTVEETTTEETTTEETTTTDSGTTVDEDALADLLGDEDCAQLVSVGSKLAEAMGAATGSSSFEASQSYFDELAEKAPEEIRDDFAVLAEAWAAIVEAYGDLDLKAGETPTAEQIQQLAEKGEELSKTLDDPKFEQASANISAWAEENCNPNG